jgi:3-oxoacyl-[acyl-carrier-protein] synthase-3
MGSKIRAIDVHLPDYVLTNEQLDREFGRRGAEKIESKLGIRERHWAAEKETAGDLAFIVASKILSDCDRDKIDMLILCTQSPDYFLPTTACVLQDRLRLRKDIGAFDFSLGCSGYIYGLAMAKAFINSGISSSVLLITSETLSKHIHPKDLALKTIFGDGAAATIIESSPNEQILEFVLGTDGSGKDNLIVRNGGFRNAFDPSAIERKNEFEDIYTDNNLYMNGSEIFNFSIETVPAAVNKCLKKNALGLDEIDYFIFHQTNKYMINYLRKKLGIPNEKFYSNMLTTGNTASATIPIAYKEALGQGSIAKGNKIMLCGFGVGYSWGATVVIV